MVIYKLKNNLKQRAYVYCQRYAQINNTNKQLGFMKKSILFFYLIFIVCLISCSPKTNDCQVNGVIVNPSEKYIKIGEQTIPISENGKFYYNQNTERPLFLDVSYGDLEWTIFLQPQSSFTLKIMGKSISEIEFNGDLVASNRYLLKVKAVTEKINDGLKQNWYTIHSQNQTDYIASIDSLKGLYWEHLANDTLSQVKKSQPFINAWRTEINFAFNKFMTYYPKNHFYYTGEKVQLSDKLSNYIYLSEIDSLSCFELPSYKDYAGDWINLKSESLAKKDTSLKNFHLKKLEATNKIILLTFTNQYLKDYWLTKYIKEHIESQGISNSEKYISQFKESCKTEVFKKEVEQYLASVLQAREDHEVKIYKTEQDFNLEAHIYTPTDLQAKEKRPAIVLVHGGGWRSGNPSWAFDEAIHFKELGMIAIAAQYRLTNSHDVTAVESMADIRDLIMWIRINSDSLGIQPDSIAAYGWSAGGHLISSSAIFCDSIAEQGVNSIPNAMILISPAVSLPKSNKGWEYRMFGNKTTISSANPVEHVRKGLPPTIILEGRDDTVTPLSGVQLFHDKMQENGNYCEIWIYDGVGHLFTPNTMSDRGDPKPDETIKKKAYKKADEFLKNLGYIKELNYEMDFGYTME